MSEQVNEPQTVPEPSRASGAEGGGTDNTSALTLDQINATLGRNYKDVESALAGLKETTDYVGGQAKYKETITKLASTLGTDETGVLSRLEALVEKPPAKTAEPSPDANFVSKEQYQEDMFFKDNPKLAEMKDILKPMKNGTEETRSMSWSDFVAQDHIKTVTERYTGYEELQGKKSVLETNPRLGAVSDGITKAKQSVQEARRAAASGDTFATNQHMQDARSTAVKSVADLL